MYSISELADELNRQEWAVERMLRNRGYLKQNGYPRKWVVDEELMDEDGMITEEGWSTFIDELGYKESNDEGDDDDDEEDAGDEEEEDDDDDDDDDDELDEEEIKNVIRSELGDVDEEIVDALYAKLEEWIQDDEEKDIEGNLDVLRSEFSSIQGSLDEGHTLAYVLSQISCLPDYEDFNIYGNMSEEEIIDDVKSVGECRGYSQATIDDVDQMYSDGYPEDPISLMEVFEEAYNEALKHYGDEEKAREYALACRRGGAVADFDDDFEEYLSEGEPWINTDTSAFEEPFPSNPSNNPFRSDYYEYSAEDIMAWYNEHPDEKPDYTSGDWEFSIGCWTFTSKAYYDEVLSAPDDEEEEDYDED